MLPSKVRASIPERILAHLIDWGVLLALSSFVGAVLAFLSGLLSFPITLPSSYFVISVCYLVIYQGISGETLGKRVMGIRLVRDDGGEVNIVVTLARYIGQILNSFLFGLGYLLVLGRERKALHDWIAGTIVVKS